MVKQIIIITLLLTLNVAAQDKTPAPPPKPEYGWQHSLVAGLTLTQVTFTDWSQGGENALAYTLNADGKSISDMELTNWTNTYKFAFGQTRLGNTGLRKADDIIDISSVFTYKLGSYVNPYVAATAKTQFAKGFVYDAAGKGTQVSEFFDPAFLMQSAGLGYQPVKEVKTRLGFALREVVTEKFNQYADDPATPGIEKVDVEGGFESVSNCEWALADNILFTTQLELFDPFKHLDEVVVRNSSSVTAKVNKYITTILSVQLINEKRISPKTQVKEGIAIGLSYTLF